jgi:hypothetical protein
VWPFGRASDKVASGRLAGSGDPRPKVAGQAAAYDLDGAAVGQQWASRAERR